MRWLRSYLLGCVAALVLGGVFVGGYAVGHRDTTRNGSALTSFELFWQVQDILDHTFIGEIPSDQQQLYGAIRGMVSSYEDPYTVFVEPVPRQFEQDELRGYFGGIGASLSRDDQGRLVLTTVRDLPAARAGVLDGDILVAVDGREISADLAVQDVVSLIRGETGTSVRLSIERSGHTGRIEIEVTRERIETPSVEWRMVDAEHGVGYVRISVFSERTGSELGQALQELAAAGATKSVLDLRGNGGGLVEAAVATTSQFLSEGVVLREVKRGGEERFYPVDEVKSPAQDWPLVVIVDAGTASASEIVAGALADHGRAILVGEKTYGKGSVQEVHQLADDTSLHVTVARWLTPNRRQIDQIGLEPDITVGVTQADVDAGRDPQLKRAIDWFAAEK